MRTRPLLIFGATAIAVVLSIVVGFREVGSSSGNERALRIAEIYVEAALDRAKFNGERGFRVVDDPIRFSITWGNFLVSTDPVFATSTKERKVLIVSTSAFTDLPTSIFFKAPPAHAVGYSDGSVGLISPAEFLRLDLSTFALFRDVARQWEKRDSTHTGSK
jgi:hypothetical protein